MDYVLALIFLICRFIFTRLQKLLWLLNGTSNHIDKIRKNPREMLGKSCENLNVLWKFKLPFRTDIGNFGFIVTSGGFEDPRMLIADENWCLFTVTHEFAYFVHTEDSHKEFNVDKHPFMHWAQFVEMDGLCRIPLQAFHAFAQLIGQPKGRVIYFPNSPRSGTTLFANLLQEVGVDCLAFGEAEPWTALPIFQDLELWPSQHFYHKTIEAVLWVTCKNQNPGQTYIIKTQSNGTPLVPLLNKIHPQIKCIFIHRRKLNNALISSMKMLKAEENGGCFRLWDYLPWVARNLERAINNFELHMRWKADPQDIAEVALVVYAGPIVYYEQHRDLYACPAVLFEDLLADPAKVTSQVVTSCGVKISTDPDVGRVMARDSQAGTELSRDRMKEFPIQPLSEEKKKELVAVGRRMGYAVNWEN